MEQATIRNHQHVCTTVDVAGTAVEVSGYIIQLVNAGNSVVRTLVKIPSGDIIDRQPEELYAVPRCSCADCSSCRDKLTEADPVCWFVIGQHVHARFTHQKIGIDTSGYITGFLSLTHAHVRVISGGHIVVPLRSLAAPVPRCTCYCCSQSATIGHLAQNLQRINGQLYVSLSLDAYVSSRKENQPVPSNQMRSAGITKEQFDTLQGMSLVELHRLFHLYRTPEKCSVCPLKKGARP